MMTAQDRAPGALQLNRPRRVRGWLLLIVWRRVGASVGCATALPSPLLPKADGSAACLAGFMYAFREKKLAGREA